MTKRPLEQLNIDSQKKVSNILLVEDNPGDARLFREYISDHDTSIDVTNVTSLKDALHSLEKNSVDVVILDLGLPDSNGIETFNKVNLTYPNVPLIVLTGNVDLELGRSLIRKGAQDYLVKGRYDGYTLLKSIEYATERSNYTNKLLKKEETFKKIIEKNVDGMIVTVNEGEVVYINPAAEEILNVKAEDYIGENFGFAVDGEEFVELNTVGKDSLLKTLQLKISESTWDNENAVIATIRDVSELKAKQERIEHLNQLLMAIREINKLISVEKSKHDLIEKACSILKEERNYFYVWIVLFDDAGNVNDVAQKGIESKYSEFIEAVKSEESLSCLRNFLNKKNENNSQEVRELCLDCPVAKSLDHKSTFLASITHMDKRLGVLAVSRSRKEINSGEEDALLNEIAEDLGLGIDSIDIELANILAQDKIKETERFAKSTIDALNKHVAVIDQTGKILTTNLAWKKFARENGANVKLVSEGVNYIDECKRAASRGEKDASQLLSKIDKIINGDLFGFNLEYSCHSPEKKRWFDVAVTKFRGEGPLRIVIAHTDITELKTSERSARENEKKFKLMFNVAPDILLIQNFDQQIVECNDAAEKILGYSREELRGMKISDIQKEYSETIAEKIYNGLEESGSVVFENKLISENGLEIPVEINASLIEYQNEKAIITQSRDITERLEAEKQLRDSERRHKELYHNAPIGYHELDINGKIVDINDTELEMLGYSREEMIGQYIWEFVEEPELIKRTFLEKLKAGNFSTGNFERIYKQKSGDSIYMLIEDRLLKDEGGRITGIRSTLQNISGRKKAELALKKNEERFRHLFENSLLGIFRSTPSGEYLLANPSLLSILGYTSISELNEIGGPAVVYAEKDRRKLFKEILHNEETINGFESWVITASGEQIWVRESARVIKDNNGEIRYYEGVVEDISKHKIAEETMERARIKAEQSDKMKSEFLAQMSHEIRTPLNAMLSMGDFIADEVGGKIDADIDEGFEIIKSSGERVIRTIDLILNVSEVQTGTYELINKKFDLITELIKPVIDDFERITKRKNLDFKFITSVNNAEVFLDEYSLNQIFLNLLDNAVKFTKEGGIQVIVENFKKGYVVRIKDTGIGISPEYLNKVFEPFSQEFKGYTRPYDGTGLGLTLVKSYCTMNDINIEVKSKKDVGTEFLLTIAAATE